MILDLIAGHHLHKNDNLIKAQQMNYDVKKISQLSATTLKSFQGQS